MSIQGKMDWFLIVLISINFCVGLIFHEWRSCLGWAVAFLGWIQLALMKR